MKDYKSLEEKIGYQFQDINLLDTALTHRSYANERKINTCENYERYEFLGDAVLEFVVSEYLYENYEKLKEGELSKLRASLVCEFTLSKIARELGYGEYAKFGKGEKKTGGCNRDSILCDLFEAVLGAIYLDGGMEEARGYVNRFLLTDIEKKQKFYDAKTRLQEYTQAHGKKLEYRLVGEEGPDHDKQFLVDALIDDVVMASAKGHNKKQAEQMAAYDVLNQLMQ